VGESSSHGNVLKQQTGQWSRIIEVGVRLCERHINVLPDRIDRPWSPLLTTHRAFRIVCRGCACIVIRSRWSLTSSYLTHHHDRRLCLSMCRLVLQKRLIEPRGCDDTHEACLTPLLV